MNESCHTWMSHFTHEWVMSHMDESCHTWMWQHSLEAATRHINGSCHTWMSHVTHEWVMSHMNESCHTWMRQHSLGAATAHQGRYKSNRSQSPHPCVWECAWECMWNRVPPLLCIFICFWMYTCYMYMNVNMWIRANYPVSVWEKVCERGLNAKKEVERGGERENKREREKDSER